LTDYWNWKKI